MLNIRKQKRGKVLDTILLLLLALQQLCKATDILYKNGSIKQRIGP